MGLSAVITHFRKTFRMSNLTPLFRKYVSVIEEGFDTAKQTIDQSIESTKKKDDSNTLKDSFVKECYDLMKYLTELRKVLKMIEPEYNSETEMTESEKDDFDTELRLQLQQYVQKFKQLKSYEDQRQRLIEDQLLNSKSNMINFLQGRSSENLALFHRSNNEFRSGVLQSLNIWLNTLSTQFTTMQQERLSVQRKFEELDFNSEYQLPALPNMDSSISVSVSQRMETTQEEIKHYEKTISKLTQEQIQLLEAEHEELLNFKTDQLKKVENINKTIMEVITLQSELSSHLNIQSRNINSIMDNQDDVEVNIKEGNKQLTKAKRAAGRTAKMTTYSAIILGIFILFLDYIG